MAIKFISFDLDGTLTTTDFDTCIWKEEIIKLYAEKHKLSFDKAYKRVWEEYDKVPAWTLDWLDIKFWFNHFDFKKDWREVFENCKGKIELYPEVEEVLKELKKKYKLVLITNSTREFMDIKFRTTHIDKYFDHSFSATSDFVRGKRGANIFKRIGKILKAKPNEILHVGDDLVFDYKNPTSMGMNALLLDRKNRTDVENRRINNLKDINKFIDF